MSHVLDLERDDVGADMLSRTDADGFFGPGHLVAEPLASRLADDETARYLVRNKKAGTTIARPDDRERRLEPDDDYQAFLLVTDRRLLFVAGGEAGDETFTLPLADVLEATAESAGLRTSQVAIETADGRRITFPSRGDVGDVAEAIADDAAAWSHAERCFENAEASLDRAETALADGDHETARDALDETRAAWDEAIAGVADIHEDAVTWLDERIAELRPIEAALRRRTVARAGATAHAGAQGAWDERDYERAADAYERAVAAYREAVGIAGDEPSDEALRRRIATAARERSILRVGPLIDAHDARGRAEATDDVEGAPEAWERALERYREALELEWGEAGREFLIDREAVREHTAETAEAAIDARSEVASRWITAGDTLSATQEDADASRLYDRAERHLEAAREFAEEVQPERRAEVEDKLAEVEDRRAGRIEPAADPPDGPMPVDSVAEALEVLGDDVDFSDEPAPDADRDEPETVPTPVANATPGTSAGDDAGSSEDGAGAEATGADGDADSGTGHEHESARLAAIRDLDDADFTDLVAAVWAARGWSTAAFETDAGTVYDLLAVRDGERLLLWTVRSGAGQPVGADLIERCATTRDRSRGADAAAIVTDGTLAAGAAERAADLDVEVVDADALCDLLEETGLVDRLS